MQIWELFQGYELAHGRYEVKRVNDKGKNEGKAGTFKSPATQELWDEHLAGTGAGLGIIPLRLDDTICWGVIDIDVIGIDHNELERQCGKLDLPLVICRSKSGGAHAFLFLEEPVDAAVAVRALSSWAAALGYGDAEIFPKQTQRYDQEKDVGNWLNMPYFHADKTNRYCIHNGQDLELNEFLEYAESMRVNEDRLVTSSKVTVGGKDLNAGMFEEGPPCLQMLHANGGFPDGTRNDGMYNVAVFLRKKFPDDWQDKMQEYNLAMCDPPLNLQDITNTAKSGARKDYEFRCRKPPIASYCDRRECVHRKYGVGEGADGPGRPELLDVKKLVGDPVLWFMTVQGRRMMMTTDEFTDQKFFKKKVFDLTNLYPRTMPTDRWERFLQEIAQHAEIEYMPVDATPVGQFALLLESYLLGQSRTTRKEDLVHSNSPFIAGDGTVLFKLRGLVRHLDSQGFKVKSESHLASLIKDLGAKSKQLNVKGKTFNVWVMDEPKTSEEEEPENNFGTTEF